MSRFSIPNLDSIRQDNPDIYQALRAIGNGLSNMAAQANVDPASSQVASPAAVSQLNVVAAGGIHDIKFTDGSPAYQGLQYRAFYSQTPDFQNEHMIDLGESQNHRANLGPGTYYWRGNSKYPASPASDHVYHGGSTPQPVGTGVFSGPAMQQGVSFGAAPYRNSATPPIRR